MIIATTNQKGGVGKTTISINLASSLALLDYRVLVIDMDPQGNSSDGLGIETDQLDQTIYDVLVNDVALADVIIAHPQDNLFIAPSNINLFAAEAELSAEMSRPFKLRKAVKPEIYKYDFIIIDCPPNIGVLTVNAILACSDLLVPIEPNSYALKGVSVLMNTILKIQEDLEHAANFLGVVVNMFETDNDLHNSIVDNIVEHFPAGKIFDTKIKRNPIIPEAEIHGKTTLQYSPANAASELFMDLAKELVALNYGRREKRQEETTQ
jgi:chromosome partitioning protein